MCSERSDGVLKHVFVSQGDILDLVRTRRDGDTEELIKYKQLTTELSDKMAVKTSEDRYVLCSRNSEIVTN